MTSSQFRSALCAKLGQPEPFNTNNSWGFGGGTGDRWSSGKLMVKLFTAGYRHLPSTQVVTVSVEGRRVFDELQSPKAFEAAAKLLA